MKSHNIQRFIWIFSMICVAIVSSGCASLIPAPKAPWEARYPGNDSSPRQAFRYPFPGQNRIGPSGRLNSTLPSNRRITLGEPSSIPLEAPDPNPKTPTEKPTPLAEPETKISGPRIVPQGVTVPHRLELDISVPSKKQVGSRTTFRLTVRNVGDETAEDVAVESEFEEALVFPGQDIKKVRQEIGRLVAGESKEVALTLVSDEIGNHCSRFAVMSNGSEAVWKSVCVEFLPKRLDLQLVGPTKRTVGSRAEFIIKLANTSSAELNDIRVQLSHDSVLKPREVSAGAEQKNDDLSWNLGKLKAGEGVQLQIEFDCAVVSEHACLFIDVSGSNLPEEQESACLTVSPVQGILDIQVEDNLDPVKVGENIEYIITVRNRGLQAARDVELTAEIPANLRVISSSVYLQKGILNIASKVEGRRLRFDPIVTLGPDAVLKFLIQAKTLRPGDGIIRVYAAHSGSRTPVEFSEITTVNP